MAFSKFEKSAKITIINKKPQKQSSDEKRVGSEEKMKSCAVMYKMYNVDEKCCRVPSPGYCGRNRFRTRLNHI